MSAETEKTALLARFLWRLSDKIEALSGLDNPETTCTVLHQSAERMLALQDEKTQLERWKAEAMAVAASWDVQAVGKLIGAQPGSSICQQIEPFLRAIIAERDALKARLDKFPVIELGVKKLQIGESIFNELPAVTFLRWHDESSPTLNRAAEVGEVEAVITFATTQSLLNLKKVLDLLLRGANPNNHEQAAIEALCLAYGLLWMSEQESDLCKNAWQLLKGRLNRDQKKAGVQAAMDAGFEAITPSFWCNEE